VRTRTGEGDFKGRSLCGWPPRPVFDVTKCDFKAAHSSVVMGFTKIGFEDHTEDKPKLGAMQLWVGTI